MKTQQKNARALWAWGVFLFTLLVAFDQLSKYFAKDVFKNYNFAFSLPLPVWTMWLIYCLAIALVVYYLFKEYKLLYSISVVGWTLIAIGAALNIGERLVLGYVRDFIHITFSSWVGIYNLADFYIILGIILLLVPNTKKLNA